MGKVSFNLPNDSSKKTRNNIFSNLISPSTRDTRSFRDKDIVQGRAQFSRNLTSAQLITEEAIIARIEKPRKRVYDGRENWATLPISNFF